MFGEIGEVVDVHIPKDRETGRPRGFAFVRFAAEEHAAQAVEKLNGREVGGRALRLDIAEDRPRPPRQRGDFRGGPERPSRDGAGRADEGRRAPDPGDYGRGGDYDRGGYDRDDRYDREDQGGRSGRRFDKPARPKGSRRGLRAKKRSL